MAIKQLKQLTLFLFLLFFIAGSVKCQTNGGDGGGGARVVAHPHHHFIRPSQDHLTLSESIARGASVYQQQPNGLLKGASGDEGAHPKAVSGSGSLDFSCPTQFGHYRDTSNCAAYYICTFGQSLHKNCSTGLYFSERLQTCDWPTNVPCERGKFAFISILLCLLLFSLLYHFLSVVHSFL